jgi:hypothetical protein
VVENIMSRAIGEFSRGRNGRVAPVRPGIAVPRNAIFSCVVPSRATRQSFRRNFLILQACHILIYAGIGWTNTPVLIAASGLITMLFYALLLRDEFRRSNWPITPLLAYCITALLRTGAGSAYLALMMTMGFSAHFIRFSVEDYVGNAHLLLMVGDWFLIAGYCIVNSRERPGQRDPGRPGGSAARSLIQAGLCMIVLSWGIRWAKSEFQLDQLGQLTGVLQDAAFPAGLLLVCIGLTKERGDHRGLVVLITSVFFGIQVVLALRSYLKQDTVRTLLPLIVFLIEQMRVNGIGRRIGWRPILGLSLITYFVVMVLCSYSELRRRYFDFADDGRAIGDVAVVPSLVTAFASSVPGTPQFSEINQFPDRGFWGFFVRNEWTSAAAWSLSEVDAGYGNDLNGIWFGMQAVVPRIFWPNKPVYQPGRDLAVVLGQARDADEATTNTGLGLAAALYWDGGPATLVMGMMINGMLMALMWRFIQRHVLRNPFATITYFTLLLESLRWFEGIFDGGVSFHTYNFVVLLPLAFLWGGLFPRFAPTLPAPQLTPHS